jgi:cysteine-rich CPCC protein
MRGTFFNITKNRLDRVKYKCPCCGYLTLPERGGDDICPVCFWEDDGQDDHDADTIRGGPNYHLSLTQARKNFANIGACDERFLRNVRPPKPEERLT